MTARPPDVEALVAGPEEHGRKGIAVTCAACRRDKAPHGRSAPLPFVGGLCDGHDDCPGYLLEPLPGCLWPGETCEEFGFAHCHDATLPALRAAGGEEEK